MSEFVVFVGAGASKPFGIPTMTEMTEGFEKELKKHSSPGITFFDEIKRRLKDYQYFDVESLITVLQNIANVDKLSTVLNNPSVHYFLYNRVGDIARAIQSVKQITKPHRNEAEELLKQVKFFIANSCKMKEKPFEIYTELFNYANKNHRPDINFKDRINHRGSPIPSHKVFTTNYDLVLEGYCQNKRLPAWDCGQLQTGELKIATNDNRPLYSFGRDIFHIYKLHGSVNWYVDEQGYMSWSSEAAKAGESTLAGQEIAKELLIYPASEKYTFREPFYYMFHHLKECLLRCQGCYVIGYSFRDEDILGLFHDAMELNGDLQLYLIDLKAQNIVEEKFKNFLGRIKTIPKEFSIEAVSELA